MTIEGKLYSCWAMDYEVVLASAIRLDGVSLRSHVDYDTGFIRVLRGLSLRQQRREVAACLRKARKFHRRHLRVLQTTEYR